MFLLAFFDYFYQTVDNFLTIKKNRPVITERSSLNIQF